MNEERKQAWEEPTYGVKMRPREVFDVIPERCKGKMMYDKKTALTAKNQRYKESHMKLREYHCPDCNHWHLTSRL
jgi:DNA-directed RNA polymerase subunit RPC12/RpoP